MYCLIEIAAWIKWVSEFLIFDHLYWCMRHHWEWHCVFRSVFSFNYTLGKSSQNYWIWYMCLHFTLRIRSSIGMPTSSIYTPWNCWEGRCIYRLYRLYLFPSKTTKQTKLKFDHEIIRTTWEWMFSFIQLVKLEVWK